MTIQSHRIFRSNILLGDPAADILAMVGVSPVSTSDVTLREGARLVAGKEDRGGRPRVVSVLILGVGVSPIVEDFVAAAGARAALA